MEIEYEIKKFDCDYSNANEYDGFHDDYADRYAIYKKGTDEILDDAQGYGYKSVQSANKAAWYKFKGGKSKINAEKNWWKQHKQLYKKIGKLFEYYYKELAIGETTSDDIFEEAKRIAEELNVTDFNRKHFDYMR